MKLESQTWTWSHIAKTLNLLHGTGFRSSDCVNKNNWMTVGDNRVALHKHLIRKMNIHEFSDARTINTGWQKKVMWSVEPSSIISSSKCACMCVGGCVCVCARSLHTELHGNRIVLSSLREAVGILLALFLSTYSLREKSHCNTIQSYSAWSHCEETFSI